MHSKMYNSIKSMIERKRFTGLEDCLAKLAVYNAAHLLTDDEFFELVELAREAYGDE